MNESGGESVPIDFARIQDTSDGDIEFEQELFAAYIEDCTERIERLHAALADGDSVAFRREAHTVKGASANVGTTRLHEIAQALESADFADTGALSALISEVDAEFQRVKAAIEAYLATL